MYGPWERLRRTLSRLVYREVEWTPTAGVLSLQHWSGPMEHDVEIVGETATKFRIRALTPTHLPGRRRILPRGRTALVPKGAVRLRQRRPPATRGTRDVGGADVPQPNTANAPQVPI